MEEKECTKCSKVKPISEFYKNKNHKDGYAYDCKSCRRLYTKKVNNPVSVSEKKCKKCDKIKPSEYFSKHRLTKDGLKNECKNCVLEYNEKHGDYIRKRNLDYFHKVDKYKKILRENKKRKEDPIFKLKSSIRSRVCGAIKNRGYTRKSSVNEILGCDWNVFKKHLEKQFQDGMTWDNYGEWHIDHIIPYACAKTEEQVLEVSKYTNLQPLWAKENMSKGYKTNHKWKN
jgi:hypothetical protein